MIIGIGHDHTDMQRLAKTLARFGKRFISRVFTPFEQARAARKADPLPTYARRFAAKEAVAKALGTGIGEHARWNEIGVVNAPNGHPTIQLTGAAAARLAAITPIGHKAVIHVSLSDEAPLASAYVIIEALPE